MALAPLYDITNHPLLIEKYRQLNDPDKQLAQQLLAEMLLDLRAPAYAGDSALELAYAVVEQVNFQLQRGLEPEILKSVSNTHPGNTTSYRDRYVSPSAWAICQRVTGVKTVGFTPPGIGV